MTPVITLINGDGIGAEVIPAAHEVLLALDLPLEFVHAEAGFGTFEQTGTALPPETLTACENSDAILFGATQSPMTKVEGYQSPILSLRRHLDLYANLRPALRGDIDMFIVRENTEGLYSRRERVEDDGKTAITERVITEAASRRIVRKACEIAMTRRKHLTLVHKANVLKETCGLFRAVGWEVVKDFPELQVDELLVDAAAMFMVQEPTRFDVIVTTNLFGDILSDLAAGLIGGLGIAPSANVGDKSPGVFEPVHGSAPDIAGKGIADPRAAILSAGMILENLGYGWEKSLLNRVVYSTEHTGQTEKTTASIIQRIREEKS
jgi:homoisocitrate dehydrogenase